MGVKTYTVKNISLDWALQHILNYYDSDFFPKPFEFEAIKADWNNIRAYLTSIDLYTHAPKTPVSELAPKFYGSFRIVHQLDPLDSLLYTALLYENAQLIETFRVPEKEKISCSYRIKINTGGSFFEKDHNGYPEFLEAAENLADTARRGMVLVADIVDFYNQIYLHRVNSALEEASSKANEVIEIFLSALNTNISRGIPVGPAASILVAELIMADINNFILTHTRQFVQYVDDLYIFFPNKIDATLFLHELCRYLYDHHRLALSPEKTKIIPLQRFRREYLKEESKVERQALEEKLEELGTYPAAEEEKDFDELDPPEKFKIRTATYYDLLASMLNTGEINFGMLRHIIRQAGKYKVRKIIPLLFEHFETLLPVIRELVIYFQRVLDKKIVGIYQEEFEELLQSPYLQIPFVNIWVFTLFQLEVFNEIEIHIDYNKIIRIREKALIARRENNKAWVKSHKGKLDILAIWDRRAVIYSSLILAKDEMGHWLGLESAKGDILNKALCSMLINQKKSAL